MVGLAGCLESIPGPLTALLHFYVTASPPPLGSKRGGKEVEEGRKWLVGVGREGRRSVCVKWGRKYKDEKRMRDVGEKR